MGTHDKPTAELVCTGSELLSGRTVNTHAVTLAGMLADLGIPLVRETTVPDDLAAIRDAIEQALNRAPIVIATGGLGPTSDDLTRDAVAQLAGAAIIIHEPTRERIRTRYETAGRIFTDIAARHALVIEGAEILPNPIGLCPGELIRIRGRMLFLLPGPPAEFRALLEDGVLPRLRALAATPPLRRILMTCCIGESDILRLLPESEFTEPTVDVAYCAKPGRVEIRLTAAPAHADALERAAARARTALGEWIYAERPCELEEAVVEQLRAAGRTLAIAESCTGGLVSHRITNVPGSSEVFLGGVVAYANTSKTRDLGVPNAVLTQYGAVSAETARAMAEGARARFGSDIGLGITGIAGPGGATPEKPVGLVFVAAATAGESRVRKFTFNGTRAVIKEMSATTALDQVRRVLRDQREG
jgi:nicotinamide-nucleotide amidase